MTRSTKPFSSWIRCGLLETSTMPCSVRERSTTTPNGSKVGAKVCCTFVSQPRSSKSWSSTNCVFLATWLCSTTG